MLASVLNFAQSTTTAASSSTKSSTSPIVTFIPIILIGAAMYFFLIRPQRRRMRSQQSLMSTLEEGDEIITNGGIYGFVTAIDGDVLWVEIDHEKNIEIRIHRSAVTRKINPAVEPAGGEPAPVADDTEDDDDEKKNKKKL